MRLTSIALSFLTVAWLQAATPVWIDTDPSVARGGHEVDDGFALLQAFHSKELQVRGVSVVFGNAPLVEGLPIARRLVQQFGPAGLPIYSGAAAAAGLGTETDASRALAAALAKERLTILLLGPATNVATVVRNHPDLSRNIVSIVAVAGRRPGQHFTTGKAAQPFRDFNFEMDPDAFAQLLRSKVPLVLAPWEISSHVWLNSADLARIRSAGGGREELADAAEDWLKMWKTNFGVDGFNPFDTLAVAYATSPSLLLCEALPVEIRQMMDDAGTGKPKPYLLAAASIHSDVSATYCSEPKPAFKPDLMDRLSNAGPAATLDHSAWTNLLARFENNQSRVDYASFKARGLPELRAYLQTLAAPFPKSFTANERKAALIDAYNALTVDWVMRNYPLESIWRTVHPFTEARHQVDGRKMSLDSIERELRNMGDARIHAALVCAALSCPPLRREAYVAEDLDSQLDQNFRAWLSNSTLNRFRPAEHKAGVSMIFDWYKGDFEKGGSSVPKFLSRFAPASDAAFLLEPGLKLSHLTYNWGVNDTSNLGVNYSQVKFYADFLKNKL